MSNMYVTSVVLQLSSFVEAMSRLMAEVIRRILHGSLACAGVDARGPSASKSDDTGAAARNEAYCESMTFLPNSGEEKEFNRAIWERKKRHKDVSTRSVRGKPIPRKPKRPPPKVEQVNQCDSVQPHAGIDDVISKMQKKLSAAERMQHNFRQRLRARDGYSLGSKFRKFVRGDHQYEVDEIPDLGDEDISFEPAFTRREYDLPDIPVKTPYDDDEIFDIHQHSADDADTPVTSSSTPLFHFWERARQSELVTVEGELETYIKYVERGLIHIALIACQTTVTGFVTALLSILHPLYDRSLCYSILDHVMDIFGTEYSPHSGTVDQRPAWLGALNSIERNWKAVINGEFCRQIGRFLSVIVSLGLCDMKKLEFSLRGLRFFSDKIIVKQLNCVDVIDVAMNTTIYFLETGWLCFQKGPIALLNGSGTDLDKFVSACDRALMLHEYAKTGNLKKFTNLSDNEYEKFLDESITIGSFIVKQVHKMEKGYYTRKLDELKRYLAYFQQSRVHGGLRTAPYTIGVFGGTSVGKSSVANILMVTTLKMNGFCCTDDVIATLNDQDKYMSNYRSHMEGIILDDLANTKADFVEKSPTQTVIEICNNAKLSANMADLELKGKISVEPKVVLITKNVKDGGASIYSNEPASIARRDNITLTVRVKSELSTNGMLDKTKVMANFNGNIPDIPDMWLITVEQAYPVPNQSGGAAGVGYGVVTFEGQPLKDVSIATVIRFIKQDSALHFKIQESVVKKSTNLGARLEYCDRCGLPLLTCTCNPFCPDCKEELVDCGCPLKPQPPPVLPSRSLSDRVYSFVKTGKFEPQNGVKDYYDEVRDYWRRKIVIPPMRMPRRYMRPGYYVPSEYERKYAEYDYLTTSFWFYPLRLIPDWLWYSPVIWFPAWFAFIVPLFRHANGRYRRITGLVAGVSFLGSFMYPILILVTMITLPIYLLAWKAELVVLQQYLDSRFRCRPTRTEIYVRNIASTIIVGTTALILLRKLYRWTRTSVYGTQARLLPDHDAEVALRDYEENPWATAHVEPLPVSGPCLTATAKQLQILVGKNLCKMDYQYMFGVSVDNTVYSCDAFFPCSNVAIIPYHIFKQTSTLKARFYRGPITQVGSSFEAYIGRPHMTQIPDTDFAMVWVPNGGDWKDLRGYFPLDTKGLNRPLLATLIHRNSEGLALDVARLSAIEKVKHTDASFYGSKYVLTAPTFPGQCMATWVADTAHPFIAGFHLGGISNRPEGISGFLTKSQVDSALSVLSAEPGLIFSVNSGTLRSEQYGVQFLESTTLHAKSPVNFLPIGTNLKVYGSVIGRATYHSMVQKSMISDTVHAVCNRPNIWAGPKFNGHSFRNSLVSSANPSFGIEPYLLREATKDYLDQVAERLVKLPGLCDISPLSRDDIICGIDGKRFIDRINVKTSVGFPLKGAKTQYITDNPDDTSHMSPIKLDEMFWTEAENMETTYLSGERCYPIFKASLKDEPTKVTKDKVRVFEAGPIAFGLLIRKYYLPIARMLSMIPLASECAVGVNARSQEWHELSLHMMKFGEDRILAGDYKTYDLRMPAQLMFAAFGIMMQLAGPGYSSDDLTIMRGLATDVCYPLVAFNGDLIQFFGSNPSGHNLTVYINSIVNSLLIRCAYFHWCTENIKSVLPWQTVRGFPPFRKHVALMTYGDDCKGSVDRSIKGFDHIYVAEFLERHDMIFTMPDKTSERKPFLKDADCDFLKRKNVFHESLGIYLGALDEDSIFKSLHSNIRSKALSPSELAVQVIDGALYEWFAHGPTVYEHRRAQMQSVADSHQISSYCRNLKRSYDDWVELWKEQYAPSEDVIIPPQGYISPLTSEDELDF